MPWRWHAAPKQHDASYADGTINGAGNPHGHNYGSYAHGHNYDGYANSYDYGSDANSYDHGSNPHGHYYGGYANSHNDGGNPHSHSRGNEYCHRTAHTNSDSAGHHDRDGAGYTHCWLHSYGCANIASARRRRHHLPQDRLGE
jgi:hypothetical protein